MQTDGHREVRLLGFVNTVGFVGESEKFRAPDRIRIGE